jgi:PKD repeat protein
VISLFLLSFLTACAVFIYPVNADPAAILKVSLPEGTYHGYDADPWLCESWFLNLTGATQTFTVRINNTSSSLKSYDTRLVIALNDAAFNKLVSMYVNGTAVPKTAFKWGTPKPYNIWTWPSGDVYPTWFNDTIINVGLIPRKGYKDLVVSVTFSDPNGARVHFDAYGKKTSDIPTSDGQITHNPLSQDSTVFLNPGAPPPQPPIASFTYTPTYPEANQIVTFDASASYDPDGSIISYTWDFGDGTPPITENDPITYHTYTSYGDYTVKLTVTDNDGLTGQTETTIHVSQHPVASFTFTPPDPLVHELVTFDASSSTPDGGTIVSYTWDFGDGNITTTSNPIITHAYETYGTFTVTLNVTDSEGKWDTTSQQITVTKTPVADFWWTPYYPQRGETVTFDASASTPDGGTIISYAWNFGDGTPVIVETDPITTHVYASVGNYTVTLNVTDSEGRWDIETHTITVVPKRFYLKVKTDPEGVTTIPGENWYNEGTQVTLSAPDPVSVSTGVRYKFLYWDVDGTQVNGNPITVVMDANHTATAHYRLEYYLTVLSPFGTVGGEGWYPSGSTAYATLNTGIVDHGNGTRRMFTNWSGDASGDNYAQSNLITMNGPKTAVANWKTQYYLTVRTDPPAITTIPGEGWYDQSQSVQLIAPTVSGYTFQYWDVDGVSQGTGVTTITVAMNAPHTATAHYTPQVATYKLKIETTTGGTTNPTPGTYTYAAGTQVQVTAIPSNGYIFDHWELNGTNVGTATTYTVTMNANYVLKAFFKAAPKPLTVSISPMSASILLGQQVTFTSTVSGGTPPYTYQWYLNNQPVSGANTTTWTFKPAATGVYFVILKVTDAAGNTAQSDPAKVTVSSVPVGGYSVSLAKDAPISSIIAYTMLIASFGSLLSLTKRRRK